ncbi:sugar transporter [Paenibacillus montaniterrae]|uniref:Sugar transporter n=1 Tax=Paenibacillus montaniterrae TaxID=429341 RepID=A0A919YRS5_9BACL|nr:MFS transporter [Paenibacillus montaniterrae]GIP16151.1 sugar transporter [Paenibacillus montaniterrae]
MNSQISYNRAKTWQLICYPAGVLGQKLFMALMMLVSYYAAGIVGLGTVVASLVITGSRFFDGITDPIVGFLIDRSKGKYGKVKPFVISGYIIMSVSTVVMFFTTHLVPSSMKLIYFIIVYAFYILGYTFAAISKWSGLAIITNDPKQRPVLGGIEAAYTTVFLSLFSMYNSLYLVPKYGGFNNPDFFQEMVLTVVGIAGILYALCVAAIWSKDRMENLETKSGSSEKVRVKDMWQVIKGNRALQIFVLSVTSDKLAMQTHSNQVVIVMLYGIIIGNFSMSGQMAMPAIFVNLLMIFFGIKWARKVGTKRGYVAATWGCIITYALLFLLLWLGDPTQIGFDNLGFMTIAFVLLMLLSGAFIFLSTGLVSPLIPDIVDYETYRTGRFVPGIISTTYSFIDKVVSSLAQTVVGLTLAAIGFKAAFPDINTPYSESIFWVTMALYIGTVMVAWIISVIAMKFYPLTKEKMLEIQEELNARHEQSKANHVVTDESKTVSLN